MADKKNKTAGKHKPALTHIDVKGEARMARLVYPTIQDHPHRLTFAVTLDAARRRDARRPGATEDDIFEQGSISDFFQNAEDPNKCINLLEIPLFHSELPWIIEYV